MKRAVWDRWSWVVCVWLGVMATGCSSFHREWREAGRSADPTNSITGRWTGTWQNTNNTHRDRMRAVVTEVAPGKYRAHFHAYYKRVFRFAYAVTLEGRQEGGEVKLKGAEDLGKLAGGRYTYEGGATPTEFRCSYDSKYDTGTFTMRRPER